MYERESKAWKMGYKAGGECNLNLKLTAPKELSDTEKKDWDMGATAAVCDRIS